MATASLTRPPLPRWHHLSSPLVFWLTIQVVFLLGVTVWQFCSNADTMKVFLSDPAGLKIAVSACGFTVVNFATLLGGCFAVNFLSASWLQGRVVVRSVLLMLLCIGCFVLLYLPALFALLIGPASVRLQSVLLNS